MENSSYRGVQREGRREHVVVRTTEIAGVKCTRAVIKKGEPLEKMSAIFGRSKPYPWNSVLAKTLRESELPGISIRCFPILSFYPDQLRVDEFLNEFSKFAESRKSGKDEMPQFILLRCRRPYAGLTKGKPTPSASVADNDLALGAQ